MKTTRPARRRGVKKVRRTSAKPRTRLEKLQAADDLHIEGPIGSVIHYAYECEKLRCSKKKGRAQ
jgi:hypothetical protein